MSAADRSPLTSNGNDLVVVAVNDECRHIDRGEVGPEVRRRERGDGLVRAPMPCHHSGLPERVTHALRHVTGAVVAEERSVGELAVELGARRSLSRTDAVEDLDRQAPGVVGRAEHERRHRGDEYELRDPCGTVPAHVMHDLAATGGMTDERDTSHIEGVQHAGEVVGVRVHLIAVPRLARSTVTAAIVRDHAATVLGEEQRRGFPPVGVQRPTVTQEHRHAHAPVLVVRSPFRPRW